MGNDLRGAVVLPTGNSELELRTLVDHLYGAIVDTRAVMRDLGNRLDAYQAAGGQVPDVLNILGSHTVARFWELQQEEAYRRLMGLVEVAEFVPERLRRHDLDEVLPLWDGSKKS